MDKLEYEQVCGKKEREITAVVYDCLLYTSDAADE